jgi:hypothetical protein
MVDDVKSLRSAGVFTVPASSGDGCSEDEILDLDDGHA